MAVFVVFHLSSPSFQERLGDNTPLYDRGMPKLRNVLVQIYAFSSDLTSVLTLGHCRQRDVRLQFEPQHTF